MVSELIKTSFCDGEVGGVGVNAICRRTEAADDVVSSEYVFCRYIPGLQLCKLVVCFASVLVFEKIEVNHLCNA